jgi:NADPH:quinone reductase-like Zn-dependent oxidoreductase
MKKPAPYVTGCEISGIVQKVGPPAEDASATPFQVGDLVFGTTSTGGLCEKALLYQGSAYKFGRVEDLTNGIFFLENQWRTSVEKFDEQN